MKINYRRGDNLKKRPHAPMSVGGKRNPHASLKGYKKERHKLFRKRTNMAIRNEKWEKLPIVKKDILWDYW